MKDDKEYDVNSPTNHRVMISAHRSGAELDTAAENRRPTLLRAAEASYDFVEFDVQRCKDGVFALYHDDFVIVEGKKRQIESLKYAEVVEIVGEVLTLNEALDILKDRTKAHVDFKFTSPDALYETPAKSYEVEATRLIIDTMGAENCIITTLEDKSVRAVRSWSRVEHPALLVGLSLGRNTAGRGFISTLRVRMSEVFAESRLKKCDANLVVAKKSLAKIRVANVAKRAGFPLLVWTVDSEQELQFWLKDSRAWLVTSNFPQRAREIRDR